ncbi:MAG: N-acetylmuramoyl-L-alanine amidase [Anaerovoracaceae bacterium]
MNKKWRKIGLCLAVIMGIVALVPTYSQLEQQVANLMGINKNTLVIDPGHGGIDGGAQSADGTSEKAINLAIAMEVKNLAQAAGWTVIMTRQTDKGLYEEGNGTIRSLKTQDLKARREIIDKANPALAISIHLNSFKEDSSVHGAQVFYPSNNGEKTILMHSKNLARVLQEQVTKALKDGTNRVALERNGIYMFKAIKCPIAIVECGFLSNHEETEKLKTVEYQQKLAESIFYGVCKFTGKNPQKHIEIISN